MMNRYHINPETGTPGLCKAKVKCRFGEGALHYASKEAAAQAFESSMEGQAWLEVSKKDPFEALLSDGNPNMDDVNYGSIQAMQNALTEQELNSIWNLDTLVRDWYFDAREEGLNHEAAYDFVIEYDNVSLAGLNEDEANSSDSFSRKDAWSRIIFGYKSAGTIALGNYKKLFDEAAVLTEQASRYQDVMQDPPADLKRKLESYERMAKTINRRNLTPERLRQIDEMSFVLSYDSKEDEQ